MKPTLAIAILLVAFGAFAADPAPAPVVPAEGTAAPTFTLPSQDGQPVSLSQFHGKWVVLYFYPKDFTSGCTIEAHNFQRDLAKYSAKNAAIVGVSVDPVDSHKGFCTKEGLNFKLLADTEHKVVNQYGSVMEHEGVTYAGAQHVHHRSLRRDPEGVREGQTAGAQRRGASGPGDAGSCEVADHGVIPDGAAARRRTVPCDRGRSRCAAGRGSRAGGRGAARPANGEAVPPRR